MGKPEGNEPSFGEQVPGLGAPSEEWQEIFRAILSAKNAHGPDSEIAERIAKYDARRTAAGGALTPRGF